MQPRAYDHVRFAVQDWSDQSMHFLRGVGTIPVNHHINISIHPTKHCLDDETFALSRLRKNGAPAWRARSTVRSVELLSKTRTRASGSSARKPRTTSAAVSSSL